MREMRDSGIPWIREIPKEWTIELIGNQVKEVNNPNTNGLEDNALQFKMGSIISKSRGDSKYNPETLEGYNIVDKGVIMLNGLNLSFDLISQRVGLVRERGVITSTYLAVKPSNNIDSEYLTYLFKAYDNCKAFHSMGRGLRQTLSYGELRKYLLLYPSLAEQQRIAEFLDRKCAEVDEMIGLQEQIIEELKAYKQSVITEAVTKGLNPAAPMRDSGIEWIGSIPEHWETHPFKAFYKTTKGLNITKENLVESGMPVISYGQIHSKLNSGVRVDEALIRFVPEEYLTTNPECLSKQHDLFFADTSEDREGAGNVVYIDIDTPIFAGYHTIIARPSEKVKSKYFAYLIQTDAWRCQLRSRVSGVKVFSISQKFINQTSVIIPPISEQQAIADYLDEKCADIDSLIQTKQSKIDSLKEYKKSIIYEYVTGKREVTE